jgi:hypothetical protein
MMGTVEARPAWDGIERLRRTARRRRPGKEYGMDRTSPHGGSLVVAGELGLELHTIEDVMTLVGAAYDADAILLTADDVDASFFDLRSGLAGELFQKVTNYGLRLALVLPDPAAHGPRWSELAHEHAHHRLIRFFPTTAAAETWIRG